MQTFNVHLIRHGMTQDNISGKYIGVTDVPLAQDGIARLKELKKSFTYPKADAVYSSPLVRCMQTAGVLYPDKEITKVPGLSEYNFGQWEGKTVDELKNDEKFTKWIANSKEITPDGGESLKDFTNRVLTAFGELVINIIKSGKKENVVVSHGGVIMTILTAYGVPKAKMYDWVTNNGMGYSVRIMPSLWSRQKAVEVYSKVPSGTNAKNEQESAYVLDLVRDISDKIYGKEE